MKNFAKILGIITLAVVIGFSMTSCVQEEKSKGGKGSTPKADRLIISGQVYTELAYVYTRDYNNYDITPSADEIISGDGIKGGKLNLTIGVPDEDDLLSVDYLPGLIEIYDFKDVTVSDPEAKFHFLSLETSDGLYDLNRSKAIWTSSKIQVEYVFYIYVDKKDVKIKSPGNLDGNWTYKKIDITLSKGWNAIHLKTVSTTSGITVTLSKNNPNLFWVLTTPNF